MPRCVNRPFSRLLHKVKSRAPIRIQLRASIQTDMARLDAAELRALMEREASVLFARASHGRPVNLVSEIVHPWSVAVMLALNGDESATAKRLRKTAEHLFRKGEPPETRTLSARIQNKWLAWHRKSAAAELDRMLKNQQLALSRPMFSGLTQTLPSFLSRSCLALLQYPGEMKRLIAEPDLMPGALEELLRYAGIVHTRHRQASSDIAFGDALIRQGQTVTLKLDSANFDSAEFDNPDRLDITRRPCRQLGLGAGPYSCVGAALVRSAFAAITPLFLAAHPALEPHAPIRWTSDAATRWPQSVHVTFGPVA